MSSPTALMEACAAGDLEVTRLLGTEMAPNPARRKENKDKIARRGDVWPASVADIALPERGTRAVPLVEISETAGAYLREFKTRMLKTKEERDESDERHILNHAFLIIRMKFMCMI